MVIVFPNPETNLVTVILVRFGLFTLLVFLHLFASRTPVDPLSLQEGTIINTRPAKTETASLASRLALSWVGGLVWKGYRSTVEVRDLSDLAHDQKCANLGPSFRAHATASFSLLQRLLRFFKYDLLLQGAWAVSMSVVVFLPVLFLRLIVQYLQYPDSMRYSTAWLCAFSLLVAGLLTGLAETQCEWVGRTISAKLRAILIGEIYAKLLRKKMTNLGEESGDEDDSDEKNTYASDGNILNLMAVDTTKVSEVGAYMHLVWVTVPLQIIIATCLLYNILGVSGVAGVILMIVLLPLNILLVKKQGEAQGEVLTATDARVQASSELMSNIRIVKFSAWEKGFKTRILALRGAELQKLRWRYIWWSLSMTVWYCIPMIITITTLFFYTVVAGKSLETSIAFPTLAVFAVLRAPLDRISDMISFLLQANVSVLRIDKFLKENETTKYRQFEASDGPELGFDNATLEWPTGEQKVDGNTTEQLIDITSEQPFKLTSLKVDFRLEGLNVVFGPSGSGKSSLLYALLGEMDLLRGRVLVPRRQDDPSDATSFCPQEPWIQNGTIMANILFGLPMNRQRYQTVLDAVALTQDLAMLDKGDQTLAGEKGSRLSGGQKQRVSLARALYSHARNVFLDDCLSAVDSRTAKHMFFNAIKGPLMKGRTCVLATHHTHLAIPHCDFAVYLDNGHVKGQGTPDELVKAGIVAADVMDQDTQQLLSSPPYVESTSPSASGTPSPVIPSKPPQQEEVEAEDPSGEAERDYEEGKFSGAVSWAVIKSYIMSMGPVLYWVIVAIAFAGQQLASLGTSLWIKEWAHQYDRLPKDTGAIESVDALFYLGIYTAICVAFVLVSFFRDTVTFYGALRATARIHERLLSAILYAKLAFFDRTPLGQIINRFSKDIEAMDQELAPYAISTFHILSSLIMVIGLISVVLPAFLIVAVFICLAYYAIAAVYINASRDLKRIESVERSPLYQQFGESLRGYVSVHLVDYYNRPHILLWASKEWLSFRISCMSALISSFVGVFILWEKNSIDPGAAGLVLTYAATFTENIFYFVQLYAEVQQSFNSVERIIEYGEVEQEATEPLKLGKALSPGQPLETGIRFRQYTTRYAPGLEPVLQDIDFEAHAGQRVAVVGRTGAGKSTLTLALIRGLEADNGQIELDGVDIASLKMEQLRQAVTVVPQDPSIFKGSLRENLDPLHRHSDEDLTAALQSVRLTEMMTSTNLDSTIGSLSLGQRQLLCIARALVRKSRVLVLDEATASIDHDTDALTQETLRSSVSANTTLLTIAHRLHTIADYDRVIVLHAGRIVENGSPSELLQRRGPEAVFRQMCEESGNLGRIVKAAGVV
ncbi:P-loop containing nucleoside triphosphate hydrolase protein [Dothidotthia symphoricarpi CBS 119687]|uniref:P-loop containing nucleoside triphosphate hydrolase protein n=1 Tax=Dothidotthia symphoricarpi CBS 119687 TaxID=1392245 RepID=A0A6A6A696_9PLEO|nr:P-loop containing nucleoside triphosphate hydrolase protein [Dothidotthia symphoricarpi CBS 119687]KAF2126673.1 P-loop containing nucleoside triphosphate hydrolase protein [Dothidotthia symphoricarpi CBS 119687]